jgi:hypothetical protein
MRIFKKLPSFQNTRPRHAVGSWVIELTFLPCFYEGMGWHVFSFGVFKINSEVLEGERILTPENIRGFRREYRIRLPSVRVK